MPKYRAKCEKATQKVTLLDMLEGPTIKLVRPCMCECGPAAQTFGGLLAIAKKRPTRVKVETIAAAAHVPVRTCKYHLAKLDAESWILTYGRLRNEAGGPCRTTTRQVNPEVLPDVARRFCPLPLWACGQPWHARVMLALLLWRIASIKAAALQADYGGIQDQTDLAGAIEEFSYRGGWRFTSEFIQRKTGLTNKPAQLGAEWLESQGLIAIDRSYKNGLRLEPDLLAAIPVKAYFRIGPTTDNGTIQLDSQGDVPWTQ